MKNIMKELKLSNLQWNHDDGNLVEDIDKADLILLGVSRTSKTPTSIYLANKGFKTLNIPLVNEAINTRKFKKKSKTFLCCWLNN